MKTQRKPGARPIAAETRSPDRLAVPPLENGDRLTAAEFLRRYAAMPGVKAELIEGGCI